MPPFAAGRVVQFTNHSYAGVVTDPDLVERWRRIRSHLDQAWADLPPGDHDESLGWYAEFLDHNELRLAYDALCEVGRRREAPESFWWHMRDAAGEIVQDSDIPQVDQT